MFKLNKYSVGSLLSLCLLACPLLTLATQPLRGGTLVLLPKFNDQLQKKFNPFDLDYGAHYSQDFVYEPLWIYNVAQPEKDFPRLAIAYEFSEQYDSLLYFLREGVKWSDGEEFDADDVVFTSQYLQQHPELNPSLSWANNKGGLIRSVEKVDRHTVRFNLAYPHAKADELIGAMYVIPEHIWSKIDAPLAFHNSNPVGTGPFTDVRIFDEQKKQLCRNTLYWQPSQPYIDCLQFPLVRDKQQVIKQAHLAKIDWMAVEMSDIAQSFVLQHPNNQYWFAPAGNVNLSLNLSKSPFDQLLFRQALSMAVDREYMLGISTFGGSEKTQYPDAVGSVYENWQDNAALGQYEYLMQFNPEHAMRKLDQLGIVDRNGDGFRQLPDGQRLYFKIAVAKQWSTMVNAAFAIMQDWQDIGLNVRLVAPDENEFYRGVAAGRYDVYFTGNQSDSVWQNYRSLFTQQSKINGRVLPKLLAQPALQSINGLLKEYTEVADLQRQSQILSQVQALVAQDLPVISLFANTAWYQYNDKWFKGWVSKEAPFVRPSVQLGVPERAIHVLNLSLKQTLKQPQQR